MLTPLALQQCCAQGPLHSSTQELPLRKPYTGAQIDDLLGTLDILSLADWYVDLLPHAHKLEALLATLGRRSPHVRLLAARTGETHAQVRPAIDVSLCVLPGAAVCAPGANCAVWRYSPLVLAVVGACAELPLRGSAEASDGVS